MHNFIKCDLLCKLWQIYMLCKQIYLLCKLWQYNAKLIVDRLALFSYDMDSFNVV